MQNTNTKTKAQAIANKTTTAHAQALALAKSNVLKQVKNGVGVTHHTNGAPIKGCMAGASTKPTAKNCRFISVKNGHVGTACCIKRWHLYTNGQTLLNAKLTAGQVINDLTYWAKMGFLNLHNPNKAQLTACVNAWQNKQPMPLLCPKGGILKTTQSIAPFIAGSSAVKNLKKGK